MRAPFCIAICIAACLGGVACAEIVDRIAVSVGTRVITATDIEREIRITALLNNEKPDLTAANKKKTAERMVDQALVRSELEASRYPPPTAAETDAALQEEKARFGNQAAYRRALDSYGVSEDDLRARLTWQLMLVRFIDARFRPGIQITDDEIRNYFNEHLRAGLALAHPGQAPSLDDHRAEIEQILAGQIADQQVEQWLKEARRRTHIEYHDEAFQ